MKRRGRILPLLIAVPLVVWLLSGIAPRQPSEVTKARYETDLDTAQWIGAFLRKKRWPTAPPSTSQALDEGRFALVDQSGRRVVEEEFRGGFLLVYFGCTACPEARPSALEAMVDAVETLGREGYRGRPILITVDPERDTVERLARYTRSFAPSLVALTGEPAEIARAAGAYGLSSDETCEEAHPADCLVDYASRLYLTGPDGRSLARIEAGQPAEALAREMRARLKAAAFPAER